MFHVANQVVASIDIDDTKPGSLRYGWLWLVTSLLRFKLMVLTICMLSVAGAVAYVALRPAIYTAVAYLQLTNLRLTFSRDDAFFAETQLDPTFIETQLQILRSDRIVLNVVDTLKLDSEPLNKPAEMPAFVKGLVDLLPVSESPDSEPKEATDPRLVALKAVKQQFSADRLGLSSIVQVKFSAREPETAAKVANDLVRAYIADQNAARLEAAQAGSSWLRERLREVGPKTRIIASAIPPTDKSNVRGILIIGLAGMLGLGLGSAIAFARSFLDGGMRTPEQISRATSSRFIGVIPRGRKTRPFVGSQQDIAAEEKKFSINRHHYNQLAGNANPDLLYTLRIAESRIGEASWRSGSKMIGVTALTVGEGGTTVAANFALSLALAGRKILLVDCNTHDGGLSAAFRMSGAEGLIQRAGKPDATLQDYVYADQVTGLHVLPLGKAGANQWLDWPGAMAKVLAEARTGYEFVILDLPPITMTPDARNAAPMVDGFILVVGWASVSEAQMKAGLSLAPGINEKLTGFVLNKIRLNQMRWHPSNELTLVKLRQKNRY